MNYNANYVPLLDALDKQAAIRDRYIDQLVEASKESLEAIQAVINHMNGKIDIRPDRQPETNPKRLKIEFRPTYIAAS